MKNNYLLLTLGLLLIICHSCNCKKESDSPKDQLPPATQTGANTLGFLLNGEAWTPKGNNGTKNLSWYYDPSYAGGDFNVSTYRYVSNTDKQSFALGMVNLKSAGTYLISNTSSVAIRFSSLKDSCEILSQDINSYCVGQLTITKFDTAKVIISGIFSVTLYNPSSYCKDTLKITEGRFDLGQ